MPDVRKMSDEELLDAVELCYSQLDPSKTAVAECPKASHEEAIAELSRRLGIMLELCRSVAADDKFTERGADRFVSAIQAFRQMESERGRP